jgi:hypothetical protein
MISSFSSHLKISLLDIFYPEISLKPVSYFWGPPHQVRWNLKGSAATERLIEELGFGVGLVSERQTKEVRKILANEYQRLKKILTLTERSTNFGLSMIYNIGMGSLPDGQSNIQVNYTIPEIMALLTNSSTEPPSEEQLILNEVLKLLESVQ